MIHSISVLVKEAKNLFDIKYLIYNHLLVLLVKGCNFSEPACVIRLTKGNLVMRMEVG